MRAALDSRYNEQQAKDDELKNRNIEEEQAEKIRLAWERAKAREEQYERLAAMKHEIVLARVTLNNAIKQKILQAK